MRQINRGYADAVIEDVRSSGGVQGLRALAGDLAAVRDVIAGSDDLQDALGNQGIPSAARRGVLDDLFGGRVGDPAMLLIHHTVKEARPTEAVETISELAERAAAASQNLEPVETMLGHKAAEERVDGYATSVLADVDTERGLGELEDELFRFLRVVDGSEDLKIALSSRANPVESRKGLVSDLLKNKATPETTRLAVYATHVGRPRDYEDLLEFLVSKVAAESNRRVADVRSAVELDEAQTRELAGALSRAVGHDVDVRVTVDPAVLGGFVATIGDNVIDASARRQLSQLRDRMVLPDARITTPAAPTNTSPNGDNDSNRTTGETR